MNRPLSLAVCILSLGSTLARAQVQTAASPVAGIPTIPVAPYGLSMQPLAAPSLGPILPGYAAPSFSVLPSVSNPKVALTNTSIPSAPAPAVALTPSVISQPVSAAAAPAQAAVPAVAAPAARGIAAPAAEAAAPTAVSPTRLAVKAEAAKVKELSAAIAPQLKAIQKPGASNEASRAAAGTLFDGASDRGSAVSVQAQVGGPSVRPSGLRKPATGARYAPAVSNVSFSEGVTAEQQSLFWESLKRRKAGWFRELARMGIKLDGPVAPALTVRSAKELKGGKTDFTVEWQQGATHLGSFRAIVPADKLSPELRRLADPPAAEEKQLTLRFKKKVLVDILPGVKSEKEVTRSEIEAFLEAHGLRLLSGGYDGIYRVAVTGEATPASVAQALSGQGIVLYARPLKLDIPQERQLTAVFKKATLVDLGGIKAESAVTESDIADLLRAAGLTVLEADRDGVWKLGLLEGSAEAASAKLEAAGIVLYATPLKLDIPESRQAIVRFHDSVVVKSGGLAFEATVREDDIAGLLRKHGLRVLEAYGDGAFRVGAPEGTSGKDLAAKLASETYVKSSTPVGTLKDEEVRSAAKGVVSHKGRPWSSTEYNMVYGMTYSDLMLRGATAAQLKLFSDLCDAAPVLGGGFNPWSGD